MTSGSMMGTAAGRGVGEGILPFGLGFVLGFRPIAGMDFHWHLAMGRAHLAEGPLLAEDPISWAPMVRPPDMGAWLGQSLFALAERLGGLGCLRALVAATVGLLFWLVFRAARRRGCGRALAWLLVAMAATLVQHRLRFRPDVFSLLSAFVVVDLLLGPPSKRRDLLLFLACALWTNLHPGVVVAPLLALLAAWREGFRRGLGAILATVLGAGLRPRGPLDLVEISLETARTGPLVPEWQPIWDQPLSPFLGEWIALALASALVVAASRGRGALARSRDLAPALGALALAWRAVRLSYFAVAPAVAAAGRLSAALEATALRRRLLAALALVLLLVFPLRERWSFVTAARAEGLPPWADELPSRYPVAAADFLEARDLRGRLFHPVKWGGYLGLRLAPRLRSAHDGRITLYGKELAEELLGFADPARRQALADRYGFEILVLPTALGAELSPRWILVHADPIAVVAVDRSGPNAAHNLRALGIR